MGAVTVTEVVAAGELTPAVLVAPRLKLRVTGALPVATVGAVKLTGFVPVSVMPAGAVHAKDSVCGGLFASLPLPVKVTAEADRTLWAAPAFAVGAPIGAVTVTEVVAAG